MPFRERLERAQYVQLLRKKIKRGDDYQKEIPDSKVLFNLAGKGITRTGRVKLELDKLKN